MKKYFICIILFALCAGAAAQTPETSVFKASGFQMPRGLLNALFNSSRFSMTQSYSLSFGFMGKYSMNQGLYLNTMTYRFADPLVAQVRVGWVHQPFQNGNTLYTVQSKVFVQRAMIQYTPSEKFSFTLDYQAFPSPYMSPYYSGAIW